MTFYNGSLYIDMPVLANQQELIYVISGQTQDKVWKTCCVRWMIGTDGERESGKPMQAARLGDDEICLNNIIP